MSGAEALSAAGLKPYQLKSKEGLSLLNGTPGATGLACLATYDAMEATKASEIMAAFSYETNKGNIKHLDPRLHSVKNHSEQQESAENILNLLKGSEISQKYEGYRMQDAYSCAVGTDDGRNQACHQGSLHFRDGGAELLL